MERVEIAVEAIEQRLLRQRLQVADAMRRTVGNRVHRPARSARAADAAIAAAERAHRQGRVELAGLRIADLARGIDDGALSRPLVDDPGDARDAAQRTLQ